MSLVIRETETKITVRCYLPLTKMAKMKDYQYPVLARMGSRWNSQILSEECTMKNYLSVFITTEYIYTSNGAILLLDIYSTKMYMYITDRHLQHSL